jgi:hypothetical protein
VQSDFVLTLADLKLMWYMSVTITPEVQKDYLEKNPAVAEKIKKCETVIAANNATKAPQLPAAQPVASGSTRPLAYLLRCPIQNRPLSAFLSPTFWPVFDWRFIG